MESSAPPPLTHELSSGWSGRGVSLGEHALFLRSRRRAGQGDGLRPSVMLMLCLHASLPGILNGRHSVGSVTGTRKIWGRTMAASAASPFAQSAAHGSRLWRQDRLLCRHRLPTCRACPGSSTAGAIVGRWDASDDMRISGFDRFQIIQCFCKEVCPCRQTSCRSLFSFRESSVLRYRMILLQSCGHGVKPLS